MSEMAEFEETCAVCGNVATGDRAISAGAIDGVQPMAFVVHSEWINRPATVIVDKEGIVRFAYAGTYWGDRPLDQGDARNPAVTKI